MHFELPEAKLKNLREFAGHYLMIVISIVTALALEGWIERVRHSRVAATAVAQVRNEIGANFDDVRCDRVENAKRVISLEKEYAQLSADMREKIPAPLLQKYIHDHIKNDIKMQLKWPALRQEAWDVAVANGSVGWIGAATLRRFSAVYDTQREVQVALARDLSLLLNGSRMLDVSTDLDLDAAEPRQLAEVLNQIIAMFIDTQNNMAVLQAKLADALPTRPSNDSKIGALSMRCGELHTHG